MGYGEVGWGDAGRGSIDNKDESSGEGRRVNNGPGSMQILLIHCAQDAAAPDGTTIVILTLRW